VLATASLLTLYATATERLPGFLNRLLGRLAPLAMQYSFGGLFSGMLIFYGRSGDWLTSAPFLLLMIGVILGNEFMKKRSDRLLYHLALYFIGIFSYVVLVVPVLIGRMGDWVFIGSGVLALLIVIGVVRILAKIAPHFLMLSMRRTVFMLGCIFVLFNTFYFLNIIPPIPLSLTDIAIADSVTRTDDGYRVVEEAQPWYRQVPFVPFVIHPTNQLACFARVYAPTRLTTDIYHRWEYRDESGEWVTHFRLGYPITGENRGGYGGYTTISSFFPGTWRCSVETERGQVLGRRTVRIEAGDSNRPTVTEWR
jgi:hypothetical protein